MIGGVVEKGIGQYMAIDQYRKARDAANAMGKEYLLDPKKTSDDMAANERTSMMRARQNQMDYDPEAFALRTQSLSNALKYSQPDEYTQMVRARLGREAGGIDATATGRLSDYILKLLESGGGGTLDTATRNEVARQAGVTASRVGGRGTSMAPAISARDLGLNSRQLLDERLALAKAIAQISDESKRADIATLEGMTGNQYNRSMGAAAFGQSMDRPTGGMTNDQYLSASEADRQERIRANMAKNLSLLGLHSEAARLGEKNYQKGTDMFMSGAKDMSSAYQGGFMSRAGGGGGSGGMNMFQAPQGSNQAFTQSYNLGGSNLTYPKG
jgi:hypothetical protein